MDHKYALSVRRDSADQNKLTFTYNGFVAIPGEQEGQKMLVLFDTVDSLKTELTLEAEGLMKKLNLRSLVMELKGD